MSRATRLWRRLAGLLGSGRIWATLILLLILAGRGLEIEPVVLSQMRGFDLLQRLFPRQAQQRAVTIVDIDEASLRQLGQWPWPRTVVAALVEKLTALGAAVVAFDVIFAEPDRTSLPRIAAARADLDPAVRSQLLSQPENDAALAKAIRSGRVVLAQSGLAEQVAGGSPEGKRTPIAKLGPDPLPWLYEFGSAIRNLPELEQAAAGVGMITVQPDADGIIRRLPTLFKIGSAIYPSLAIETLRVATGRPAVIVRANHAGVESVVAGAVAVPTDEHARIWVRFSRADPKRYVSAFAVLQDRAPAEEIRGHLVFVGTSAVGLHDLRATPISAAMPGVELHAHIIETILAGDFVSRPGWVRAAELLLILLTGVPMIVMVPRFGASRALVTLLLVGAAVSGLSLYLFLQHRLLIDGLLPLLSAIVLYSVLVYANYSREETRRARIREAFGQYLSPTLVEQLSQDPDRLVLGGEVRTMTIMFSDIRGFTTIAERFKSDPNGLTRLINSFLTPMTEVIHANGGTIDKYIGDCVMAFWNAPLEDSRHAERACRAALQMLEALEELNRRLREQVSGPGSAAREDYLWAKRYSEGPDAERDYGKAAELLQRAAKLGLTNAQYSLGKAYRDGQGVEQDAAQAAHWFRLAALQGHPRAQQHLGWRYATGEGVEENLIEAAAWLDLAARAGVSLAEERLRSVMAPLGPEARGRAEARAQQLRIRTSVSQHIQFDIGVGINTGECLVGNMGSAQRFDYTVLGDCVNLASRLEAQSKNYGVPIILGEDTEALVRGWATLELDLITVKGKLEPARIFTLIGDPAVATTEGFQTLRRHHAHMLAAYRRQDWADAETTIRECIELAPSLTDLYEVYIERIQRFRSGAFNPDWDGVYADQAR